MLQELSEKDDEINDLTNELHQQEANTQTLHIKLSNKIAQLEERLGQKELEILRLCSDLAISKVNNADLAAALAISKQQIATNYSLLRNERRKTSPSNSVAKAAQALVHLRDLEIRQAEENLRSLERTNTELEQTISDLHACDITNKTTIANLQEKITELRQKIRRLQMRAVRTPMITSNAVAKTYEWLHLHAPGAGSCVQTHEAQLLPRVHRRCNQRCLRGDWRQSQQADV
ncbi:hypothetical protein B0H17DRAFT_1148760 [Mycena rosella]|uniref:Uncharacterized protein n=1 Tax=Mycena rosella TaxID=1033263 RepID=A0AAD7C9M7_MYCRO|nr:hypothetical protein B0H17DRAFT_1148760 [Mycena rosella]